MVDHVDLAGFVRLLMVGKRDEGIRSGSENIAKRQTLVSQLRPTALHRTNRSSPNTFISHASKGALKEVVMKSGLPQPTIVPPGSGEVLNFLGVTHKLTHHQTGGAYYLFESEFGPESGNRLHVHRYEDEVVYVSEGAIEIRLDNQKLQASAGGVAHLPKNIPHALYNPLKTPLRIIAIAIPGGMENFFDELGVAKRAGVLDDATHRKISLKYGIEWLE